LWFSFIQVDSNYWLHLAPAMFVLALGFGLGVIAMTQAAVYHTQPHEAGIASALLNSAQQIGVALGLAVLAGIAAAVTSSPEHANLTESAQLVTGYGSALTIAAGLLIVAGILAVSTLPSKPTAQTDGTPALAEVGHSGH
jgi:hypothetical protein